MMSVPFPDSWRLLGDISPKLWSSNRRRGEKESLTFHQSASLALALALLKNCPHCQNVQHFPRRRLSSQQLGGANKDDTGGESQVL